MKVDERLTKEARRRHADGVKRLHEIFRYDPNHPTRPIQHGGAQTPRRGRAK